MNIKHQKKVEALQNELKAKAQRGEGPLCLGKSLQNSNVTRSRDYKKRYPKLDMAHFSEILEIDPVKKVAYVEPKVTFYELTKKTLEYGLQAAVIPEFKGITIGGAINGAATESSGHTFGLFSDICSAFHILLGNGEVVRATKTEHSDLYYGISSSYGSLGTIVQVEIDLIACPSLIKLTFRPFTSAKKALDYLAALCKQKVRPDYIDGLIFSDDLAVIMEGVAFESRDVIKPVKNGARWFYQHAFDIAQKGECVDEYFLPIDYFFRYDQGAFWMGAYLFKPGFILRFLLEGLCKLARASAKSAFSESELAGFLKILQPPTFLQSAVGPLMSSQRLYGLLHRAEEWVEHKCIVQDYCVPMSNAEPFLRQIQKKCGTYPLWLCPMKKAHREQVLAPNAIGEHSDAHILNFGVYGLADRSCPLFAISRALEMVNLAMGGRKLLYSHSYYPQEEFWKMYSFDAYKSLREKYHADGIFLSLDQKVL